MVSTRDEQTMNLENYVLSVFLEIMRTFSEISDVKILFSLLLEPKEACHLCASITQAHVIEVMN